MDNLGFIHEELDLKILILYILKRLPAEIEPEELFSLCLSDGAVDWFGFSICLSDLTESGHVEMVDGACVITEKGRRNADTVENSLPCSVQQRAEKATAVMAESMLRSGCIVAKHSVVDDACTAEFALSDGVGEILRLKLLCADESQAKVMEKRFRRNAEEYYQKIVEMLSE
jgi:hypothetical protein